ncbi:TMV resistance protein N-like [Carya illinoinensis]|uniref:TMV resistance protein N-like n=1 Tax=Carya illinoinensis TaxID=32201 RepID=UPI001C71C311|nr:TMV resistance protein N-like [Carya illinoinensis]
MVITHQRAQRMTSSMAFQGPSSSSLHFPSSPIRPWNHDVFLSFRGEDVRQNFISHLYQALYQKGINTYIDNNLKRGEEIWPELSNAIEGSMISIIIFSKNYAESKWCLNELLKILDCKEKMKQFVLPIFYNVDPSEVRHQKEDFGKAFTELSEKIKDNVKVLEWKVALEKVADFSGFPLASFRDESELIHTIIEWVDLRIVNHTSLHVAKYPVGLESRAQDVYQHLSIGRKDITCMIGIVGIGGIGKTTISKKIYNMISSQFEGSCFLKDVRETSQRPSGLIQLQNKLLYEILRINMDVRDIDRGVNVIWHRLRSKRVLLILDDVDELVQLENLAGDRDWFGLGSRIIITTRDRHLLNNLKADSVYEVKILDNNEALRLFSWHAFEKEEPIENYVELSKQVLQYAKGLPLVLTILGSDLKGRSLRQWESALDKYGKTPNGNIQKVLQTSYDGLDNNEKDMFLDIAFFFNGGLLADVIKVFDSCSFSPDDGINRLIDKCLITVDSDALWMHDVLQDMGREIVRLQSPKELGKRSRLWFHEDVRHVLEECTGINKVEGMVIDLPDSEDMINLGPDAFVSMKGLRVFINRNARFSEGPNYLSNELRVLDWSEYPMQSLPPNFNGKKLIVFRMRDSLIMELGQRFKNLRTVELINCKFLTKIPDLSSASNLVELNVKYCASLVEVHDYVGFLDNLSYLSFEECPNLSIFPRSLKLRSLHQLKLIGCASLRNFPEIESKMEKLRNLYVEGIGIEEFPLSIRNLVGLHLLYITSCKKLVCFPTCTLELKHLRSLSIDGCQNIVNFGKRGDKRQSILAIESTAIEDEISSSEEQLHELPPPANSSHGCTTLQVLNLPNCSQSESNFFTIFNSSASLTFLDLSKSEIVSLPPSIKGFVGLVVLKMTDCKKLVEIPGLPPNIEEVHLNKCKSLERFPEVSKILQSHRSHIRSLAWINLSYCDKINVNIWNRHGPNPLLQKGHYHKVSSYSGRFARPNDVKLSGTKAWVIDIEGPHYLENISGIALYCVVFFKRRDWLWDKIRAAITCDVSNHVCYINRGVELHKFDFHSTSYKVWVAYSSIESFKLKVLDNLRVHFYVERDHITKFYKSCGANVVYKDERRAREEKETRNHFVRGFV